MTLVATINVIIFIFIFSPSSTFLIGGRRSARIKKLIQRTLLRMPKNLGVDTFPDQSGICTRLCAPNELANLTQLRSTSYLCCLWREKKMLKVREIFLSKSFNCRTWGILGNTILHNQCMYPVIICMNQANYDDVTTQLY